MGKKSVVAQSILSLMVGGQLADTADYLDFLLKEV